MTVYIVYLAGYELGTAQDVVEVSPEAAAAAYIESAGLIVDIPSIVALEVRERESGTQHSLQIDLEPAMALTRAA